ncbi:MAG: hypothetical protein HYS25_01490 [Ignavibacteriales bacterium]|nr:hypothetical protein [Ignavibacteriales bacterium]
MGINSYNDDEIKFARMINDLKELPKVDAPDNFEYNLLTKIQNKNFGVEKTARVKFNFIKFFAPSAAVVAVIILFFLFLPTANRQNDNPLMSDPAVISRNQGVSVPQESLQSNMRESEAAKQFSSAENKKFAQAPSSDNKTARSESINQNKKYPISRSPSVALDDYISGDSQKRADLKRANVVSSGNEESEFDGFFIREQADKQTVEKYRQMMDSLKKAKAKQDSLKKANK